MSDDRRRDKNEHPHPNPSHSKGEGLKVKSKDKPLPSPPLIKGGSQSAASSNDDGPYPGLRPYREDEKGKFFGRDTDTEILIDKVLTNRLTVVVCGEWGGEEFVVTGGSDSAFEVEDG